MTAIAPSAAWAELDASPSEADELSAYAGMGFDPSQVDALYEFPLDDEPCVAPWAEYAAEARQRGAAAVLRRHLVQLRFPVAAGIAKSERYLGATRRGETVPDDGSGARFERPDQLDLRVHATAAGRIGIVVAGSRADFETLIRVFVHRNEPAPVPSAMGACIIGGYNNWDRVERRRAQFGLRHPEDRDGSGWDAEWQQLIGDKSAYQDRFIILSRGPYSATPASDVGLTPDEWLDRSLTIRLEHECAHYFTRRVFGSMRNTLLDEVIADAIGLIAATGRFRADWFRRFMGVDDSTGFRPEGRLHTYRGTPPVSDGAFAVLQKAVRAAASVVEAGLAGVDGASLNTLEARARLITTLARIGLPGVCEPSNVRRIAEAFA